MGWLGDHPAQQHQVALVGDGAVVTQQAEQIPMEPGMDRHETLVWSDNPRLLRLPAQPTS